MDSANNDKICVVLYSGGMDSTVVLHHALANYNKVYALAFDYGQRNIRELTGAENYITNYILKSSYAEKLKYSRMPLPVKFLNFNSALTDENIEVPKMKEVIGDPQNVAYVPNRNMIFLSLAVGMAESVGAPDVLYGAAKADDTSGFWDCTPDFRNYLNTILSLNRRNRIEIKTPLIDKTKKEIIEYGLELGVEFGWTRTCYTEHENSCGECPSCSARIAGWLHTGKIDPLKYSREIDWQKYNCQSIY
jgi:7-cyano-7-deazaguanine synthase